MSSTAYERVSELTGVVRELVRDAMGTTTVSAMLNIIHQVEKNLWEIRSSDDHAIFRVLVGKVEVALMGGDIGASGGLAWDVYFEGDAMQHTPRFKHLGTSLELSTPQMLNLLLKVASA